jgi:hypothetical protein
VAKISVKSVFSFILIPEFYISKMSRQAVVIEITENKDGYCIAALDLDSRKIIRPMKFKDEYSFWNKKDVNVDVGSIFDYQIDKSVKYNSEFPHKNEDTYIEEMFKEKEVTYFI